MNQTKTQQITETNETKKIDLRIELANEVLKVTAKLDKGSMIQLRRTAGLTVDKLPVQDKLIFYSLFPGEIPYDKYILNCILFGVQVACLQDGALTSNEQMQGILGKTYETATSKSTKARIEAFMASDGRYNEMFFKDLSYLVQSLIKKKQINVFSLTADLISWDTVGKYRWLNTIIRIRQEELRQDTDQLLEA